MYKSISFIVILLLFAGCSLNPKIDYFKSVFVTLKTEKLKYSDAGFLKLQNQKIKLQLFNAGVVILDLTIKNNICINKICYKKESFNAQFLGFGYYDNFLSDILLKKPIYNGKNLKHEPYGFSQEIISDQVEIIYKVTEKNCYFKDKKSKLVIKLKDFAN